jgi:hypothetical protein
MLPAPYEQRLTERFSRRVWKLELLDHQQSAFHIPKSFKVGRVGILA